MQEILFTELAVTSNIQIIIGNHLLNSLEIGMASYNNCSDKSQVLVLIHSDYSEISPQAVHSIQAAEFLCLFDVTKLL